MKVVRIEKINGIDIYLPPLQTPTIDPLATKIKTAALTGAAPESEKYRKVFMQNAVYSHPGPGRLLVDGETADELQRQFNALGKNELIAVSGEITADFRGVEYWEKDDAGWNKHRIDRIGMPIPAGAILPESLTPEQWAEIAARHETERIAALPPEKLQEEKEAEIQAAKSEARIKKEEAEIADEAFDAKAWFKNKKAEIEEKYFRPLHEEA
jgi:hypothetical protein